MPVLGAIKALTFDVFGTVVDWRGSIIREGEAFNQAKQFTVDWGALADRWRGLYQPSLAEVREGRQPWMNLDQLHRLSLDTLIPEFGLDSLTEAERDHLVTVWHRLDPWPDVLPGLARLRQRYILATLSNGHVALIVAMAKRAGLPWDAVLGAEVAKAYKPQPEAYLTTARLLGLEPAQCLMVAAHPDDLAAAASNGFRTAYVRRPDEYGPGARLKAEAYPDFDLVADSLTELADKLGA